MWTFFALGLALGLGAIVYASNRTPSIPKPSEY